MQYFEKKLNVRWSKKYEGLVNILNGLEANGEKKEDSYGWFDNNAYILIFAATLGLEKGQREKPQSLNNTVDTDIFNGHKFQLQDLSAYLALIAYYEKSDVEIFKMENDSELIHNFEELVGGGFKFLSAYFKSNADQDANAILTKLLTDKLSA